jgi:hypothetical protein
MREPSRFLIPGGTSIRVSLTHTHIVAPVLAADGASAGTIIKGKPERKATITTLRCTLKNRQ